MTADPRVTQYRRLARLVTAVGLLHALEKQAETAALPFWSRRRGSALLEARWQEAEARARSDVQDVVERYQAAVTSIEAALRRLHDLRRIELQGKIDDERSRLMRARATLGEALASAGIGDFAAAGKAVRDADRELWALGGPLTLVLNEELNGSAFGRELRDALASNQQERRAARVRAEAARRGEPGPDAWGPCLESYALTARYLELMADVLARSVRGASLNGSPMRLGDNAVRVVSPQDLERFDDVGGLAGAKDVLRRTIGVQIEHPDQAAQYGISSNRVLLYGPPGTGKTLLARAAAGEYGLRYVRVHPAMILGESRGGATNLARIFELARESSPCLLLLDDLEQLARTRTVGGGADARGTADLQALLDDCAGIPGLVIMGVTTALDDVDPGLRDARFHTKLPVPMPDAEARAEVIEVQLRRRNQAVAWSAIDVHEVARSTAGYNASALAALVAGAAERAMRAGAPITQPDLVEAIRERTGRDRVRLETPVRWDDVVLPAGLERRLREVLHIVQHPELADAAGISPPAGILLYGPPGTGKTTIARALATEVHASFYEVSAAELLSKWVGESEERVARLFATARENRPSIIFIDEIDSLLRRRSATSIAAWEERLVSQFLRELDGLRTGAGVFLVGATNRLDIIDDAIVERRLVALEVPLPDHRGRRLLLDRLFARVHVAADVNLDEMARATERMSGADLKRLRDDAGMKALGRSARGASSPRDLEVAMSDLYESLQERRVALIPD